MKTITNTLAAATRCATLLLLIGCGVTGAPAALADDHVGSYLVNAGDTLRVSVWEEVGLDGELLVRPDGKVSFPLVGEIQAGGRTVDQIRSALAERLGELVPDASVSVDVKTTDGNRIYVLGLVNTPGAIHLAQHMDVMQALSMAGGLAVFAKPGEIKILRRGANGQVVIPFDYDAAKTGEQLKQNIVLRSGDVVVVP